MFTLSLKRDKCKGCGLCLDVCPQKVLRLSTAFNRLGCHFVEAPDHSLCTGCKRCVTICPDVVIELHRKDAVHRPGPRPRKKSDGA